MKSLYEVSHRQVGYTTFLSIICHRGNISVPSSEKVIPPVIEYDIDGNYTTISPADIVRELNFHPYKARSKEFNEERLADLEVASLFKQLEHFPTLPLIYKEGVSTVHPIAEEIYSSLVYLKPTKELATKLNSIGYVKRSRLLPKILQTVADSLEKDKGVKLDLFSVPKRKVGTFAYIADEDGIAKVAKLFSFGMHKIIPVDRIARELSSLKSCEEFLNPCSTEDLPDRLKPFVTGLRVAIVGTEYSMLDSGDLYSSALPKLACRLSRKRLTKDVNLVPMEQRNLVYRPFRSGIEVYHEEEVFLDETETTPGTIRLIFPGGVKVATQYTGLQLKDSSGDDVDALLSFETFAKKGALACFLFGSEIDRESLTTEKAIELFKNIKREKVFLEDKIYEGYIIDLPVMRPGQRYTELSKPSNEITVDLIAKAILNKKYVVRPHIEKEYKELVALRHAIIEEIRQI
jgi:hypothetical protein